MSSALSLKEEFESYGIDRAYLARLEERFRLRLPQDFDYFVIDTTHQIDQGESAFYEIILTNGSGAEPASTIKVKRFIAPRLDVFDRRINEPGSRRHVRNPIEQDAIFLPYFGQVQVYGHFPEHNILLMEKWCDHEDNESLEARLIALHRLYRGGSNSQRGVIRRLVLDDLTGVIDLTVEHSEKATLDFDRERKLRRTKSWYTAQDEAPIFYQGNNELRINTPNPGFFVERVSKYLESIFYITYYQARKLIDPVTKGVIRHTIEDNRLVSRQAEFLEKTKLDKEYKAEISALARALVSTNPGIVHFDTRSPNILVREERFALCDYEKISYAARAIDQALVTHDTIVNGFDITLDEKRQALARANLNEDATTDASLWAILRLAGAQAMLQLYHSDKYLTLLQKSYLYDNKDTLEASLRTLSSLLVGSRKYPHLQGVINFIQEVENRWTRRTSPIAEQRFIEEVQNSRKPRRNTHPNGKIVPA